MQLGNKDEQIAAVGRNKKETQSNIEKRKPDINEYI